MQEAKINKSNLGKYVLWALIGGLICGQLVRTFITDAILLDSIADNLHLVANLFLRLIKMIIAPLIFSTLVVGISKLGDAKSLGRMFVKSMLIFIIGGMVSLLIGLLVVDTFQPGLVLAKILLAGKSTLASAGGSSAITSSITLKGFMEQVIPASVAESFAGNHIMQIVIFSMFFGIAGVSIGEPVAPVFNFFELISKLMFKITDYVMLFAPLAVFCAIAGMVTSSGLGVLSSYLVYVAEFMLAVVLLWTFMIIVGFLVIGKDVFRLLRAITDILGVAFSTASSEAVLPALLEELEEFGIRPKISGFVLPLGYSFNLVASMLNCVFATMFIIQLHGYHMTLGQELVMLGMLMITSKGIAGIPRASLVIVAATLASMGIPESAILILFPVDGFLDMVRTVTNVFANALASAFVNKWEKE